MLKSREELEKYLTYKFDMLITRNSECQDLMKQAYAKYSIPMGYFMDIITNRIQLKETSEFIMFCILDVMDEANKTDKTKEFYTKIEIDNYSKIKYQKQKLSFPISIKCIPVTETQWIGATDTNFFIKLRDAQLIHYNENTQRTLQRTIKNGQELYKISLNKSAINEIKKSYNDGTYIPNTITLNIIEESNADFYYDKEKSELVINSIDFFDITDGYHRYVAMSFAKNTNEDFNYPMEIRITNFVEDKARHFIFQEDQKTKMKKSDSDSLSISRPANSVCIRLNENIRFNLRGEINNNGGQINMGAFASVIEKFYFNNIKTLDKNTVPTVSNTVCSQFNAFTELNEKYMNMKYGFKELFVLFGLIHYKGIDYQKFEKLYDVLLEIYLQDKRNVWYTYNISDTMIAKLGKIIKEVEENV